MNVSLELRSELNHIGWNSSQNYQVTIPADNKKYYHKCERQDNTGAVGSVLIRALTPPWSRSSSNVHRDESNSHFLYFSCSLPNLRKLIKLSSFLHIHTLYSVNYAKHLKTSPRVMHIGHESFAIAQRQKRSERQRWKGKIYPSECRVPKNSKER